MWGFQWLSTVYGQSSSGTDLHVKQNNLCLFLASDGYNNKMVLLLVMTNSWEWEIEEKSDKGRWERRRMGNVCFWLQTLVMVMTDHQASYSWYCKFKIIRYICYFFWPPWGNYVLQSSASQGISAAVLENCKVCCLCLRTGNWIPFADQHKRDFNQQIQMNAQLLHVALTLAGNLSYNMHVLLTLSL